MIKSPKCQRFGNGKFLVLSNVVSGGILIVIYTLHTTMRYRNLNGSFFSYSQSRKMFVLIGLDHVNGNFR